MSLAINLEDVWVSYGGRSTPVLRGVDLQVGSGDALSIVGPSGSGKTTLLRVVLGFLRPNRGRVEVLGQEPGSKEAAALRTKIGYIPQQLGLVQNLTALENALLGSLSRLGAWRSLLAAFHEGEVERARSCLECVGLGDKADKKVYQLSGGERQRVAIARALVQQPSILLADEFLSDLDHHRAQDILEIMRAINRGGQTMVMVTHDLGLASGWGKRAVIINEGRKVAEVDTSEMKPEDLVRLLA